MKYISVIVPVYNAGKYLDETITGIASQMDSHDELILVNDGSTDESAEICKKYVNGDSIKYFSQKNAGAPAARNKGIDEAAGRYLFFFDADDVLYEDVLPYLHRVINESDYDIIVGNYYRFDGKYRIAEFKKMERKTTWFSYYMMDPFPGCRIYKKSLIDKYNVRFENIRIGQDLNFNLKMLGVSSSIKIADKYFSDYRYVQGSISHSIDDRILDIEKSIFLCEEFYNRYRVENDKYQLMYVEGLKHINYQMHKILQIDDRDKAGSFLRSFENIRGRIINKQRIVLDCHIIVKKIVIKILYLKYKRQIEKYIEMI